MRARATAMLAEEAEARLAFWHTLHAEEETTEGHGKKGGGGGKSASEEYTAVTRDLSSSRRKDSYRQHWAGPYFGTLRRGG